MEGQNNNWVFEVRHPASTEGVLEIQQQPLGPFRGDGEVIEEFRESHPNPIQPSSTSNPHEEKEEEENENR